MAEREDDYDSDAPEEFTAEQGLMQDEKLTKIRKENKSRIAREGKERRRQWAKKLTPRKSKKPSKGESVVEEVKSPANENLLPSDIVTMLAASEKKVFESDDEEEEKPAPRKKKLKSSGSNTVILKDTQPPQCLQKSLEFLKQRKMQVARSTAVLNNSNQALRFLSHSGLLKYYTVAFLEDRKYVF